MTLTSDDAIRLMLAGVIPWPEKKSPPVLDVRASDQCQASVERPGTFVSADAVQRFIAPIDR